MNSNSFQLHRITFLSCAFCTVLLIFRFYIAHNLDYLFMVWNLFLAIIPYALSSWLLQTHWIKKQGFPLLLILGFWLLFLPNAPYLITDLIHLRNTATSILWLDLFMLFTFAWTGLLLGAISMHQIFCVLTEKWNVTVAKRILFIIVFLCGFGIYLGRFQRWNSWELFSDPIILFKDCLRCISHPEYRIRTWGTTIGFGSLLWISFLTIQTFLSIKKASR